MQFFTDNARKWVQVVVVGGTPVEIPYWLGLGLGLVCFLVVRWAIGRKGKPFERPFPFLGD